MARVAIYPGSFDPPTLGHQEVLRQALEVFDKVVVVVGANGAKAPFLSRADRQDVWAMLTPRGAVDLPPAGESIVDTAFRLGALHVVRGLRGVSDVTEEQAYRVFVQQASRNKIGLAYFMVPPHLQHVSSTAVRSICQLNTARVDLRDWMDIRVQQVLDDRKLIR